MMMIDLLITIGSYMISIEFIEQVQQHDVSHLKINSESFII